MTEVSPKCALAEGRRRECGLEPTHDRQWIGVTREPHDRDPDAHKWSADVTEHSDALDIEKDVFTSSDPKQIAR